MQTVNCSLSSHFFNVKQVDENKEDLKLKLKEVLREKSDAFNSENPEEDKVCDM